jgi:hypothetical protein
MGWNDECMAGLGLKLTTFADMTNERALAIALAFDAHPNLRPLKVGGDPARIKVEPSLAALVEAHGLPIEWLTVRRNGKYPDFESGEIDLLPGRGGWIGSKEDGAWTFSLLGNHLNQGWVETTIAQEGALDEIAALFEDLVVAADAAHGYVIKAAQGWVRGDPKYQLLEGSWLNYFGRAFIDRAPELLSLPRARLLSTGGVLIRMRELPSDPRSTNDNLVEEILGRRAFSRQRGTSHLPTVEEHLLASPGTDAMPWDGWEERDEADKRTKKFAAAKRRLAKALAERAEPSVVPDPIEWSTSFGLDEWQAFAPRLAKALSGEMTTAAGKAVLAVIENAPLDHEGSVSLNTKLGPVRLGWFIDDVDIVDAYLFGTEELQELCERLFEES